MKKLKSWALNTNYKKFFTWFFLISLVLLILGGIAMGLAFRTQISEGISYAQEWERNKDSYRSDWEDGMRDRTWHSQHGEHDDYDFYDDHDFHDGYDVYDGFGSRYGNGHSEYGWSDNVPFTRPSTGAMVLAGVFHFLCFLIFAIYWLAVVAWLYKAAVLSDMNHWTWPLAGLVGNLCAVVVFLVVRSVTRQKCPSCGRWQKKGAPYCANCGATQQGVCPNCGANVNRSDQYCPTCGKKLWGSESGESQSAETQGQDSQGTDSQGTDSHDADSQE